ncbi:MAG: DNA replication complex subunit Gins51 [Candidatus Thorarchaeota archaeon SMTZ1-45]
MSDLGYEDIKTAWENETENDSLQDLGDLRLSKMIAYLSKVRLSLASTDAEKRVQADILTQEALNLEFMIEDLLVLRRQKILKAVISGHRPIGDMMLAEEELYNRAQRALDGHTEFVKDSIAGAKPKKKPSDTKSKDSLASDTVEFVTVRFLRPISDAFLGLDEKTYGPFKKEDIAMIPAANARTWLRDGTVVRIVAEGDLSE